MDQKVRGLTLFVNGNNLTCKSKHITLFNNVFVVDIKRYTLQLFYLRVNIMNLKNYNLKSGIFKPFSKWANGNKGRFCQQKLL